MFFCMDGVICISIVLLGITLFNTLLRKSINKDINQLSVLERAYIQAEED